MIKLKISQAMFAWESKHKKNLTYDKLAVLLGVSLPTLHRWKNGKIRYIDLVTLATFCKVLECEVSDLLEYKKD